MSSHTGGSKVGGPAMPHHSQKTPLRVPGNTVCLGSKCYQIVWWPGFAPDPAGELTASPNLLTGGYNSTPFGARAVAH